VLISVEGTGKNQMEPGQYGGCSSIVTLFFTKKSLTKTAGVLEHCREAETNCWFFIFQGVSF
jgi:hypothetical protein